MKQIKDVLAVCHKHQKFLVVSHHNPDADAAASALSMALFLRSLGKKVTVVNEDALPQWLGFLPQAGIWKKASDIDAFDYDAAIVLDCGDRLRIGGVEKLLVRGKPIVNIDHHITNDKFGTVNWVTGAASSTCEVLFELFEAAHMKITRSLAVLLYSGIMTDTGSFRYENTSPRTLAIAAALVRHGIKVQEMYERLYIGIPVKDLKLFIEVIHQAKLSLGNKVYCVVLPIKTLKAFSSSFDLKEKLFTFLRTVNGIELVAIFTEVSPKETRINFRSQGDFNVAALAQEFNGGGHRKAAGAKVFGGLQTAQKQILAAIARELKG